MSEHIQAVHEKVSRYFAAICPNGYQTTDTGLLTGRTGSTSVFIAIGGFGAGLTRVAISAPILLDVVPSVQLFQYIALDSGRFPLGRVVVRPGQNPQLVELLYEHSLLGDYLDQEEFNLAVSIVGQAADQLDNELQSQFGGRRMHEDAP